MVESTLSEMTSVRRGSCHCRSQLTYLFAFNVTIVIRNTKNMLGTNRTKEIQILAHTQVVRTCVAAVQRADQIVVQKPPTLELSSDSLESLRTRRIIGAKTREINEGFSSILASKCP